MSKVVVGVDGGGTKTNAALYTIVSSAHAELLAEQSSTLPDLSQLGGTRATTGSTNWNSVGDAKAKENLFLAIDKCLQDANKARSDLTHIVLGMACVDTARDKKKLNGWLQEFMRPATKKEAALAASKPAPVFAVHGDAVIALASGTAGVIDGVVLIAGTGVISYGRNAVSLEEVRVAGWGPLLGDAGSGYSIGCEVLKAVMSAHDGRGPPTALTRLVLEKLKLDEVEDLIEWAYGGTHGGSADAAWSKVAALAPLCFEAASPSEDDSARYSPGRDRNNPSAQRRQDPVALDILIRSASVLAANIKTVLERLGLSSSHNNRMKRLDKNRDGDAGGGADENNITNKPHPKIVISGGVGTQPEIFERIKAKLGDGVDVVLPSIGAEVAAALLAIRKNDLDSLKLL